MDWAGVGISLGVFYGSVSRVPLLVLRTRGERQLQGGETCVIACASLALLPSPSLGYN